MAKKKREIRECDEIGATSSLLSSDLREQLGLDEEGDTLLVGPGKRQKKEKKEHISEEVIEKAKKLSKSQKKRLESIQRRQENERKQKIYMAALEKHAISEVERSLLTSGKRMGQIDTTKQALQRALKRHRAGLKLSEDEYELLFPGGEQPSSIRDQVILDMDSGSTDAVVKDIVSEEAITSDNPSERHNSEDDVDLGLRAFGATTTSPKITILNDYTPSKKKHNKKSSKHDQSAVNGKHDAPSAIGEVEKVAGSKEDPPKESASSIPKGGFGASILGQLAAMKASGRLIPKEDVLAAKAEEEQESGDEKMALDTGIDESDSHDPTQPVYRPPKPIELPAMTGAAVQSSSVERSRKSDGLDIPHGTVESSQESSRRHSLLSRTEEVIAARMQLPVCKMEQEIVEAIMENDAVIVCGETGSGKSTQIPQFLYEAGFTSTSQTQTEREGESSKRGQGRVQMIGVTQPRRVAAVSTARRVGFEMGCPLVGDDAEEMGEETKGVKTNKGLINKSKKHEMNENRGLVGYQIRHDASTLRRGKTGIKFMTDGVLLREVSQDLLLRQYNVVILDEAHERSVNTDILLGLLTRSVQARRTRSDAENTKWASLSEIEKETFTPPIAPLKLVIMSATLRVQDFLNDQLFPQRKPPVINVEARQFPVTEHFSRRTELRHYLKEAHKKVVQIHTRLPPGAVLVFLTGKREIMSFVKKLRRRFNHKSRRKLSPGVTNRDAQTSEGDADGEESKKLKEEEEEEDNSEGDGGDDEEDGVGLFGAVEGQDDDDDYDSLSDDDAEDEDDAQEQRNRDAEEEIELVKRLQGNKEYHEEDAESTEQSPGAKVMEQMLQRALMGDAPAHTDAKANGDDDINNPGNSIETEQQQSTTEGTTDEIDAENEMESRRPLKALVLPLYAMLPTAQQSRVFATPPPDTRLIVVATNVAETSLTIPGVRYVVDTGRTKAKRIDTVSGVSQYRVQFVSQASAEQRKGRAGRTGPGHVYRLYSSAFFHNYMSKFSAPEILQTSLEGLVLSMKSNGIKDVAKFPFPTPPPTIAIDTSMTLLRNLGAIVNPPTSFSSSGSGASLSKAGDGDITQLGRKMALFTVSPRHAKMLIAAHKTNDAVLISLTLSLVAAVCDKSPFVMVKGTLSEEEDNDNDNDNDEDEDRQDNGGKKHRKGLNNRLWYHPDGDALAAFHALGAFSYSLVSSHKDDNSGNTEKPKNEVEKFCDSCGISAVQLSKALEMRSLLQRQCRHVFSTADGTPVDIDGADDDGNYDNNGNSLKKHAANSRGLSGKELAIYNSAVTVAKLPPPTAKHISAMKQLLLVGSVDNVARLISPGVIKEGSRRKRLTAYQACNDKLKEFLYIHPLSACYNSDPTIELPEYVIYGSLTRSNTSDTVYMTNVTPIHSAWLSGVLGCSSTDADTTGHDSEVSAICPLLAYGAPLQSPRPFYDAVKDAVLCYSIPRYGVHKWELPVVTMPLSKAISLSSNSSQASRTPAAEADLTTVYRWFGRFLLEGRIVPSSVLSTIAASNGNVSNKDSPRSKYMRESASSMTSTRPSTRVTALLNALKTHQIATKSTLLREINRQQHRVNMKSYSKRGTDTSGELTDSGTPVVMEEIASFLSAEARKQWRADFKRFLKGNS